MASGCARRFCASPTVQTGVLLLVFGWTLVAHPESQQQGKQEPAAKAAPKVKQGNGDTKTADAKSPEAKSAESKSGEAKTDEGKPPAALSACIVRPDVIGAGGVDLDRTKDAADKPAPHVDSAVGNIAVGKSPQIEIVPLDLPTGANASEVASKVGLLSSSIKQAIVVNPRQIVVLVDAAAKGTSTAGKDSGKDFDLAELKKQLKEFVAHFEIPNFVVFTVALPGSAGNACDVAHAVVNAVPGIEEISTIGDSQLIVKGSIGPDLRKQAEFEDRVRARIWKLA